MRTNIDRLRIVSIEKIVDETPSIRTLFFRDEISSKAKAGQFLMVWIPRMEELPMSVMISDKYHYAALTIRKKGFGSSTLYNKAKGESLGIRGPYGNSFKVSKADGKVLLVGGGTGLVPLLGLTKNLNEAHIDTTLIIGAKSKTEVFFEKKAKDYLADTKHKIIVATEDGSYGIKGYATDAMLRIISKNKFDTVYTCGPELMMRKVFDIASAISIPVQASLERYMKCGIGICASCCIGDRLVCKDGTIFNSRDLRVLSEFGRAYRDKSGRKCRY